MEFKQTIQSNSLLSGIQREVNVLSKINDILTKIVGNNCFSMMEELFNQILRKEIVTKMKGNTNQTFICLETRILPSNQ